MFYVHINPVEHLCSRGVTYVAGMRARYKGAAPINEAPEGFILDEWYH